MSENWYKRSTWGDETHLEFYQNYKAADKELQEKALITQARLLSKNSDETILKAAESLLLLWIADHFDRKKAKEIYDLIIEVCKRMGDLERASQFESYLKSLKHR